MKWSLTGWSDWTYCVQNEMSEIGLQGKGLYVMKPLPHTLPFMGEDHQKEKQRQRSHRREHQCSGWMLPFAVGWPQCPSSPILAIPSHRPIDLSLGQQKARKEGSHYLKTSLSGPSHARGFHTAAPNAQLCIPEAHAGLYVATTGTTLCHFLRCWKQAA